MSVARDAAARTEPGLLREASLLVGVLTRAARTLAVAESLTGGSVTDALVAVPGASACLRGAVVAYATDLKARVLGVPQELLDQHGAVHPDVALAMAQGVRVVLDADYGLATTGVAGPEPQDGVPPGTYHVALVGPGGSEVVSASAPATGVPSRSDVRSAARDAALSLALRRVGEEQAPRG